MKPHPSARRFIQNYGRKQRAIGGTRRPMDLKYNPDWKQKGLDRDGNISWKVDPTVRFMVTQSYPEIRSVQGYPGLDLGYSHWTDMPVLYLTDASKIDNRWIPNLEDARLQGMKEKVIAHYNRKDAELQKKYLSEAEDFAKYYYDAFRSEFLDPFNYTNVNMKDPTRKRKEYMARTGKDYRFSPIKQE